MEFIACNCSHDRLNASSGPSSAATRLDLTRCNEDMINILAAFHSVWPN